MIVLSGDKRLRLVGGLLLICIAFLASCSKVKSTELVGTWTVSTSSRDVVPVALQKGVGKLSLASDGTFVASELPALFYMPEVMSARLESGSGEWKLVSREGKQQVQLDFERINNWSGNLPFGTQLEISRGLSTVTLYYSIGDPDAGRNVKFEKK